MKRLIAIFTTIITACAFDASAAKEIRLTSRGRAALPFLSPGRVEETVYGLQEGDCEVFTFIGFRLDRFRFNIMEALFKYMQTDKCELKVLSICNNGILQSDGQSDEYRQLINALASNKSLEEVRFCVYGSEDYRDLSSVGVSRELLNALVHTPVEGREVPIVEGQEAPIPGVLPTSVERLYLTLSDDISLQTTAEDVTNFCTFMNRRPDLHVFMQDGDRNLFGKKVWNHLGIKDDSRLHLIEKGKMSEELHL